MNHLLSSAYQREDWIDFLQTSFLPNDFKLKRQAINIEFKSRYIKPQAYWIGDCDSLNHLAIIEISHTSENDPRIGVSRDAFRLMAELNLENALFFFVSESSNNYRFSLITLKLELEGTDVKYKFSNPKRFSFYLGEHAKTRTPESFLMGSGRIRDFADLEDRFSVEVVNKEFYKEIQSMFYSLVGGKINQGKNVLDYPPKLKLPDTSNAGMMQEFGVRLIGRLVFCWFLKKKLSDQGNPIIPAEVLSSEAICESYYHQVLEPLFFEVLNTPLEHRHQAFRSPLYDAIPFLNGGLFDPTLHRDYYIASTLQKPAQPAWNLKIPDQWFSELFGILESYNFTIDENTSIDIDLSVDPEMLGRIFENLLAELNPDTGETARKASGSFYTPRVIVEYMVDEALIQYLKSKTSISESDIRDLLDFNIEECSLSKEQRIAIIDALDQIKVLDPACGSGAFPIGILQKMLLILQKVDPESIEWVIRQLDKIPNLLVRKAFEEKLMNENWKYKHKMGIIQNAIYGVDIQPIATEISKLRLFLSLIVDESVLEDKDNKNIHPLPNLSFKFVTANSLIPLGDKGETIVRNQKIIKDFDAIRERYLHAHNAQEKAQIKKDFARLNRALMENLMGNAYQQSSFLDETQDQIDFGKDDSYLYKLLAWDPFSDKASSWFEPKWMFGIKDGFDIVIGNPPYVRADNPIVQDMRKSIIDSWQYETLWEKWDLYVAFLERAFKLLKTGGLLVFIIPDAYMASKYAKKSHDYFLRNAQINRIDFCSSLKVFDAAVRNIIVQLQNIVNLEYEPLKISHSDYFGNSTILKTGKQNTLGHDVFKEHAQESVDISNCILWGDICYVSYGLRPSSDERYWKGEFKKEDLISDVPTAKHTKRYVEGKWVHNYHIKTIKYLEWGTDRSPKKLVRPTFPELYTHNKLIRGGMTGAVYDSEGLLCNHSATVSVLWFDLNDVSNRSISLSISRDYPRAKLETKRKELESISRHFQLMYLLAVLNSRFGNWMLVQGRRSQIGFYPDDLKRLPVKKCAAETQTIFCSIVEKIMSLKLDKFETHHYESQIDLMVYRLYELSYSEAKLIDPDLDSVLASFGLSAQDFERMTIEELAQMEVN